MNPRVLVIMLIILIGVGFGGASLMMPLLEGGSATRTVTDLNDASTYFDTDSTKSNVTLKVVHPQYSMNIGMPYLRPFNNITSFTVTDPYDSSIALFNATFSTRGKVTIAKTATVTGTFNVTDVKEKSIADTAGSVVAEVPDMSDTIGLEAIFPISSEAYLEEFFKGFIPFRDSEFYTTYLTTPTTISASPKSIMKNLATALFETYEFQSNGTLVATPLTNSYATTTANTAVTILGISAPDVYGAKNIGKVSNSVTRKTGMTPRYVFHTERNRDYIEAIIVNKVFDGNKVGKEAIVASLVDSVMQIPTGVFIVPDKKFKVNPDSKLPVVRSIN